MYARQEERQQRGMTWETGIDRCTRLILRLTEISNEWLLVQHGGLDSAFCGDLCGKEIQRRGNICKHTADSLCWAAELTQGSPDVAQRLKRLPPMRETRVRSLGWEDPLEKEMATHSSLLAWKPTPVFWPGESHKQRSLAGHRVGHDWVHTRMRRTKTTLQSSCTSIHF